MKYILLIFVLFSFYFSCYKKKLNNELVFSKEVVNEALAPDKVIGKLRLKSEGSYLEGVKYILINTNDYDRITLSSNGEVKLKAGQTLQDKEELIFEILAKYDQNYKNIEVQKVFVLRIAPFHVVYEQQTVSQSTLKNTVIGNFSFEAEGIDDLILQRLDLKLNNVGDNTLLNVDNKLKQIKLLKDLTTQKELKFQYYVEGSDYKYGIPKNANERTITTPLTNQSLKFKQVEGLSLNGMKDLITGAVSNLGTFSLETPVEEGSTVSFVPQSSNNANCLAPTFFQINTSDKKLNLTKEGADFIYKNSIKTFCVRIKTDITNQDNSKVSLTNTINVSLYSLEFTSSIFKPGDNCLKGRDYIPRFLKRNQILGAFKVYYGDQEISNPSLNITNSDSFDLNNNILTINKDMDLGNSNPSLTIQLVHESESLFNASIELKTVYIDFDKAKNKVFEFYTSPNSGAQSFVLSTKMGSDFIKSRVSSQAADLFNAQSLGTVINGSADSIRFKLKDELIQSSYLFTSEVNQYNTCITFDQEVTISKKSVELSCDFTKNDLPNGFPKSNILKPDLKIGELLWKESGTDINWNEANSNRTISYNSNNNYFAVANKNHILVSTGFKNNSSPEINPIFTFEYKDFYKKDITCQLNEIKKMSFSFDNLPSNGVKNGVATMLKYSIKNENNAILALDIKTKLTNAAKTNPSGFFFTSMKDIFNNNFTFKEKDGEGKYPFILQKSISGSLKPGFFNLFQNSSPSAQTENISFKLTTDPNLYETELNLNLKVNPMSIKLNSCNNVVGQLCTTANSSGHLGYLVFEDSDYGSVLSDINIDECTNVNNVILEKLSPPLTNNRIYAYKKNSINNLTPTNPVNINCKVSYNNRGVETSPTSFEFLSTFSLQIN